MTLATFSLDLGRYAVTLYALPPLLVGAASLALGVYVLYWTRASGVGLRFWLFSLCLFGWLASFGMAYSSPDDTQAIWWIKLSHLGLIFLPTAIAAFLLAQLDLASRYRSLIRGATAISLLLVLGVLTTDLFFTGYRRFFWGLYPQYGPLGSLFVAGFALVMLLTLAAMWKAYRRTTSTRNRRRTRILLAGFGVSYLASVDWAGGYGLEVYPFGYLPVFVLMAMTAYVVLRYRLADITPRTAANEILEMMEGGLIVVDLDGRMRVANKAAGSLLGVDDRELRGKQIRDFLDLPPRLLDHRSLCSEPILDQELTLAGRAGQPRELLVSASTLRESKAFPIGIIYVLIDISERKRSEEALARARDEAEEASRAKSAFLANLSHEIRTPLNGVIGAIELCLDTPLSEEQKTLVSLAHSEANALYCMLNAILDLSKIEAGRLEIEQIPFDLKYLLDDISGAFEMQAARKSIRFETQLAPGIPSGLVGDPGRMRQVFVNLLGNAIKFTPEGGRITVSGRVEESLGERVRLHFAVTDTGIGIPRERQGRIFESFTQADGSISRRFGGTGLGTTIAKQLCGLMGGSIGVESDGKNGSTFWFTVLLGRDTAPRSPASPGRDPHGLRVLVVNDLSRRAFSPAEDLAALGCLAVEVSGAAEALAAVDAADPPAGGWDCVVLNLQTLSPESLELVSRLKKRGVVAAVPIVALTSIGILGDGGRCCDTGIHAYLTGPVTRRELSRVLAQLPGCGPSGLSGATRQLITRHTIAEGRKEKARILLVEDYPTNQQIMLRYLRLGSYAADLAADGQQAVEAARDGNYDLILMDIQMPVMDGFEATRAIRRIEAESGRGRRAGGPGPGRSVIVAMTAHALKGDREKCLEAGMDDYLTKPVKKEHLLATLEKWISAGGGGASTVDDRVPERGPGGRDGQPIDLEEALAAFEGDRRTLLEFLERFVLNVEGQLGAIERALVAGDAETVRREAHAIRGGAALLLADELSRRAGDLERVGESGSLAAGEAVFEAFRTEYRRLGSFLEELKAGRPAGGSSAS